MNISFLTSAAAIRSVSRPFILDAILPTTFIAGSPTARGNLTRSSRTGISTRRGVSSTSRMAEKFKPARRVAGQKQDVWSIVNEAAAASPVQPIVNMGQGFL